MLRKSFDKTSKSPLSMVHSPWKELRLGVVSGGNHYTAYGLRRKACSGITER